MAGKLIKNIILLGIAYLWIRFVFYCPWANPDGEFNLAVFWVIVGFPLGIMQMTVFMVPHNYDVGGSVAVMVFNLVIAGLIGGVILAVRIVILVIQTIAEIVRLAF